jgi:hypothetical protein
MRLKIHFGLKQKAELPFLDNSSLKHFFDGVLYGRVLVFRKEQIF